MSRYDWVIFDADGTLFDYNQAEISALKATLNGYGIDFTPAIHESYVEINTKLWKEFELGQITSKDLRVRRFEELAFAESFELPASEFSDDYLMNLGDQRDLIVGAEEVLERISKHARLVVATNGITLVQRSRFDSSAIQQHVEYLVISEEIGYAKPDPRYFEHVFEKMGHPDKSRVLMVGDGLTSDIAGGAGFGIDTCWFNPDNQVNSTTTKPTYQINDLFEVIDIAVQASGVLR